jgi:predicted dehydrogenase
MQKEKVKWAILGAGKIAHKFAQDIKAVPDAELVAVASRDKERAAQFAAQYNIPTTLSYDELYASTSADAVYIATTHNFHCEQSIACMEGGKAVLCEKPIAISDSEAAQMTACADKNGVFLMEALWTYFLPAMQQARTWVSEGKIGTIKTIHADFCYEMEYNPEGRLFNPLLAGGALLDLGIYPVALATYFMDNKPDDIKATAFMSNTAVDESTTMMFRYPQANAFLYASMRDRSQNKARIVGTEGHIEIPEFFKAQSAQLFNKEGKQIDAFTDGRTTWGYDYEIREATACILRGEKQSSVVPHRRSNELQEILTEVRRQIGLHYPSE